MTERLTLQLRDPQQAHMALMSHVWPLIKAQTMAGREVTIDVSEPKRSGKENRLLHAMLGHIARTQEWAGQKRDIETWKRLLTASWCRAMGEQVELLPALDGYGVDIVFRRTSQLTRTECASLIEFVFAWGAANDVVFPEPPKKIAVDQDTGEITTMETV